MNGFGNWLRNVGYKLRMGLQRFMEGRYGTDKLNMAILCTGLAFSLLASTPLIEQIDRLLDRCSIAVGHIKGK